MNLLDLDIGSVFQFSVSPLQLLLRGTLMYWFLFVIFRFVLRRDAGAVGISDFLFVVILGDAAQNAMIGSATSTTDGMVLIGTLVFWNYMLDFLSYRFAVVERFTSPPPLCLVRDGRRLRRNMRREYITDGELNEKLREAGIEHIDAVKRVFLEADGQMSIIKRAGAESGGQQGPKHRGGDR